MIKHYKKLISAFILTLLLLTGCGSAVEENNNSSDTDKSGIITTASNTEKHESIDSSTHIASTERETAEHSTNGNSNGPNSSSASTNQPGESAPKAYTTNLKVHFIDVGQADCILVELPTGETMLIDAGNNADQNVIAGYLSSKGINRLDYFIATHYHEDHIGSADYIISNYEIGSVHAPRTSTNTKTFEDFLTSVKNKGLKIKAPEAGSYLINDNSQLSVQVLAPNSPTYEDMNNYSIVLRLKYKDVAFLFTGDAENISENEMLAKGYVLASDVLKVGHHGSNSSTTVDFLAKVKPRYAVISADKDNSYGHPSPDTLKKLNSSNAQIFRTDEAGTIVFSSDGIKITVDKKASTIKENAPPQQSESSKNIVYIGNKNTKKFHLDTCRSLPDPKNQIKFNTRQEVVDAGYVPCKICNP